MNCLLERGSHTDNHLVLLAVFIPPPPRRLAQGFFFIFQLVASADPGIYDMKKNAASKMDLKLL